MVFETNIFDRVYRYFSVDPSLDSLAHCKFHTTYSTTHFSLCILVYLVLGIEVVHALTVNRKMKRKKFSKFNDMSNM